jgi:hypothetical protein
MIAKSTQAEFCTYCLCRPATHGEHCGVCVLELQTVYLGACEGRTYSRQPLIIDGATVCHEVYEQTADARRFVCTGQGWPNSAPFRRMAGK